MILLRVTASGRATSTRVGSLTDAALRGRLAHFDAHSANELAAVRRALAMESGQTTVYEQWAGLAACLRFWHGFVGSQVQPLEWSCERCGTANREEVGASVGESLVRACRCGERIAITVKGRPLTPEVRAT